MNVGLWQIAIFGVAPDPLWRSRSNYLAVWIANLSKTVIASVKIHKDERIDRIWLSPSNAHIADVLLRYLDLDSITRVPILANWLNLNVNISKMLAYSNTLVLKSNMSIAIFKFHLEQLWRSMSWFSKITLKPRELAKKNNDTFMDIDILYRTRSLQPFYPSSWPRFEDICSSVVRYQPIGNANIKRSSELLRKYPKVDMYGYSLSSNETTSNDKLIYCTFSWSNTCKMLVSWKRWELAQTS